MTTIACNKREIIPAPVQKVELESHFFGKINGTDLEFTEDVLGYTSSSTYDLQINALSLDSAVYYSTMSSPDQNRSITVGHGSIQFDANTASVPSLSQFNNFYNTNLTPFFSNSGKNGFTIQYKDTQGRTWRSNQSGILPSESVAYSNVRQESDANGDYSKFTVAFNTYVYYYDFILAELDSLAVTQAVYTGWYKR
jgi:hypothetical protein